MADAQRDWSSFALLLVDMQRDFWGNHLSDLFGVFPQRSAELLALCRREGIEVVHVRALFQADQSDWMVRYKLAGRIPCVAGTPGAEVLPWATEQGIEQVFTKRAFDAFQQQHLRQYLRLTGKRFLLVAGLVTSTCVLFSAVSAMQAGLLTAVVEDACADEPMAHEDTLERYRFIFERVTVGEIVASHDKWTADLTRVGG